MRTEVPDPHTLPDVEIEGPTSFSRADEEALVGLGEEICELAAHVAAATCRLLALIADFDRRNGWLALGCRSTAHWLNWRCGYDLRSGREKVRVARALEGLPLVREAFSRGEVSYSKVRAITRIATPDNEEMLLTWARTGTAAHLEKIVRGYRRVERSASSGAEPPLRRRYLKYRWEWDGSLRVDASLPPEVGALFLEALQAAAEQLPDADVDAPSSSPDPDTADDAPPRDPGPDAEPDGGSAEPSSSEGTGISAEDGSAEPPLDEPERWARRNADALFLMAERSLQARGTSSSADRHLVVLHLDSGVLLGLPGRAEIAGGPSLDAATARRLACDAGLVAVMEDAAGNVLDIGRKSRKVPPAIRRAVRIRDGTCRFPGCEMRRHVDCHHIIAWEAGGPTSVSNLVLLCPFHHRLLHRAERPFTLEVRGDEFVFRRPDGGVLEAVPIRVEPGELERRHAQMGLAISERTITPEWYGDRCDYGVAVEALFLARGRTGDPDLN